MQIAEAASHGLFWAIIGAITGAGGLAGVYKLFLERKKPQAETQEIEARAEGLEIDNSIKAGDLIVAGAKALAQAEKDKARLEMKVEQLTTERDNWKDKYKLIEKELYKFQHGGNGRAH